MESFSIDDFDWSGAAAPVAPEQSSASPEPTPPPVADGAAPEPSSEVPVPTSSRRGQERHYHDELLPPAYRDYERKNRYRRPPAGPSMSVDDFDWGGPKQPSQGPGTYDPSSDWAITRGVKAGREGGVDAVYSAGELMRIAALPQADQAAAMLEFAKRPKDPGATQLQVPGIENIHGAGDFFTWLGESSGQMLGSMLAAAQTGGLAGAGAGAGIGGAGGAAAGPAGAAAGAVGGAITGFGYGSIASYGAMGVGGMFQDLMADADIQKALAAGQVTPTQILAWSTGAGAVIGALDAFPAFKAGHRVAGELAEGTLKQGFTKAILKGTLKGAGEEGITEGLQGAISELGQGILSGNPDLMKRGMSVLNQALVGAVGGGGPGVLGGISEERRAEPPPGQVNPAPAGGGGAAAAPVHPPQPQGPGGTGAGPAPPAGAGAPATTEQYAAKPEVGAGGVSIIDDGGVDPDVLAATGGADMEFDTEEEGDFEAGDVAPTAVRRPAPTPSPGAAAPAAPGPEAGAAGIRTPAVPSTGDLSIDAALAQPPPAPTAAPTPPAAPPAPAPGPAPSVAATPAPQRPAPANENLPGQVPLGPPAPEPAAAPPAPEPAPQLDTPEQRQAYGERLAEAVRQPVPVPAAATDDAVAAAHRRRTIAVQAYNRAIDADDQAGMAAAHEDFMDAMVALGRVDRAAFDHYASLGNNVQFRDELERRLAEEPGGETIAQAPPLPPHPPAPLAPSPTELPVSPAPGFPASAPGETALAPEAPAAPQPSPSARAAQPPAPEPAPTKKRVPRGAAVVVRPEPEAAPEAGPTVAARRVRTSPRMVANLRARAEREAQGVEPVAEKVETFLFPDAAIIPVLRQQNPRLAAMPEAELRRTPEYKNKREPAWQRATKQLLRERGATVEEPRAGVTRQEAGRTSARQQLTAMLRRGTVTVRNAKSLRKLGTVTAVNDDGSVSFGTKTVDVDELFDNYVLDLEATTTEATGPIPITRSAHDRAAAAMRAHFARSDRPVRLKPLGFTDEEIAALQRAGLAVRGSMNGAEFRRWEGSREGLTALETEYAPKEPAKEPPSPWAMHRPLPAKPERRVVSETTDYTVPEREAEFERQPARVIHRATETPIGAARPAPTATVGPAERVVTKPKTKVLPVSVRTKPGIEAKTTKIGPKNRFKQGAKPSRTGYLASEVERELRQATELPAADIKEVASKSAASFAKKAEEKGILPLELAREKLQTAIKKAVDLANKLGEKRAKAAWAEAEAQLRRAQELYKKNTVFRTGKVAGTKKAKSVREEAPRTTERLAKKEFAKPEAQRRDPHLAEIGDLMAQIKAQGKTKEKAPIVTVMRQQIEALKKQRITAAEAADVAEDQAAEDRAEAARAQDELLYNFLMEQVQRGELDQETADKIRLDQREAAKYKTKAQRKPKTDPLFETLLAQTPLPELARPLNQPSRFTPGQSPTRSNAPGARDAPTFWRELKTWGLKFVADGKAALDAAGVILPDKVSEKYFTPYENTFIFVRNIVEAAKTGTQPGAQLHDKLRGQSLAEAYQAVQLVSPKERSEGQSEIEYEQAQQRDNEILHGLITDASKSKAAEKGGSKAGMSAGEVRMLEAAADRARMQDEFAAEMEEAPLTEYDIYEDEDFLSAAQEAGIDLTEKNRQDVIETIRDAVGDTDMLDKFKEALIKRGMNFAPDLTGKGWLKAAEKQQRRVMGTIQAVSRYIKKRPGWQGILRDQLIKGIVKMIGNDVPVHVVAHDDPRLLNGAGVFMTKGPGGSPAILISDALSDDGADFTLGHELIHAATHYAITHDIKGTRKAFNRMLKALQATVDTSAMSPRIKAAMDYAFTNEDELSAALQDPDIQAILKSTQVPVALRAELRAFARGREVATFWDWVAAIVERAIGVLMPGRQGLDYLTAMLETHERAAMGIREQAEDWRGRKEKVRQEAINALFSPASIVDAFSSSYDQMVNHGLGWQHGLRVAKNKIVYSAEHLKQRVADQFFGGRLDNPYTRLMDELLSHNSAIEEESREIDQLDMQIQRWLMADPTVREDQVAHANAVYTDASVDGIDPRKAPHENWWIRNDAFHPTKRKRSKPTQKHVLDSGKRAAYARYRGEYHKIPQELRAMLDKRADLMAKQMVKFERGSIEIWLRQLIEKTNKPVVLPAGMSVDQAVTELYNDKVSPELEAALGDNAETMMAIGRFGTRGTMYWPTFRAGTHFITGRRDIPTPATVHGTVAFDQKAYDSRGVFHFVFDDVRDAVAYVNKMGTSGEERVLRFTKRRIDPTTGKKVPADEQRFDAQGNEIQMQDLYYVTMQDRFMAMDDDLGVLHKQVADLRASGEFKYVSDPGLLESLRSPHMHTPRDLQSLIANIDSMSGIDDHEKSISKAAMTHAFIQRQQGSLITKKLQRRQGVAGYETGAVEMLRALKTNNDMMSRQIVGLERRPRMTKARKELRAFREALQYRTPEKLAALSPEDQALATRDYGKDTKTAATRLDEDIRELESRIENSMKPNGGGFRGEKLLAAVQTALMLAYLGSGAYFVVQGLGFTMQTLPNMVGKMSRTEGASRAFGAMARYTAEAYSVLGLGGQAALGGHETVAEMLQFAQGFAPRKGWRKYGRVMRRAGDHVQHAIDTLKQTQPRNWEHLVGVLEEARALGFIGQAGLDQPNIKSMQLIGGGLANKVFRGIEQSGRIFRSIQEPIEFHNRALPLVAYVNFYLDKGLSPAEAKKNAINHMVNEQTAYQKEAWPNWMGYAVSKMAIMFKKFGLNAAVMYYGGLAGIVSKDSVMRREAMLRVGLMTGIGALLGGFAGNPLWEPFRFLFYLLYLTGFVDDPSWSNLKTKGQLMMDDIVGKPWSEALMYGAPRFANIDLSSRLSQDSLLFFEQPKEMSQDEWYRVLGTMLGGAPASALFDTASAISSIRSGDKSIPKWAADLPVPRVIKDLLKAYDAATNGPTTATGVHTGKPPPLIETLLAAAGVRTATQARPFETGSAAQHSIEQVAQHRKQEIVRAIINQGMTERNKKLMSDYNQGRPYKERITSKSLVEARKRRGKLEREIEAGNEP